MQVITYFVDEVVEQVKNIGLFNVWELLLEETTHICNDNVLFFLW